MLHPLPPPNRQAVLDQYGIEQEITQYEPRTQEILEGAIQRFIEESTSANLVAIHHIIILGRSEIVQKKEQADALSA